MVTRRVSEVALDSVQSLLARRVSNLVTALKSVKKTQLALRIGVEYANVLPIVFVQFDKLKMPFRFLIRIVCCLIFEGDIQAHLKILVIHVALEFYLASTHEKRNHSRMFSKVFVAGGNKILLSRIRIVFERKVNVVN